jgi:methionyl-tRNA synthetase
VQLPEPSAIFPRIEKEKYMSEIAPPAASAPAAAEGTANLIDIAHFTTIELKVGQVLACEAVPKSEKLLKLRVDLGDPAGPRQVLAGIAKTYAPEDLVGTQVVVVANLKPAKLMGHESQGMVLAATDPDGRPILLRPQSAGALPGARVK